MSVKGAFILSTVIVAVCSGVAVSGSGNQGKFVRYARIFPVLQHSNDSSHSSLDEEVSAGGRLSMSFLLDGKNVTADLVANDEIVSAEHFISVQREEDGVDRVRRVKQHEVAMCHYHGHIRNHPNSYVALSTCDGIRGIVYDHHETYLIDFKDSEDPDKHHYIYRQSVNRVKRDLDTLFTPTPESFRAAYRSNSDSLYVELVLVIDNAFYRRNANEQKLHRYCLDLVNVMNVIYRPLNIYIALVGVVIWSNRNPIEISTDSKKTLENFLGYRRNTLLGMIPHDNAHLLTGVHFSDSVVGKAEMGSMCTFAGSGGVEVVDTDHVALQASTIAHEMGHNFNIDHDEVGCSCPSGNCVMASKTVRTQAAPNQWSSCSVEHLKTALDHGLGSCLKNKPAKMFVRATCGNGLLEPGEQCDCGMAHVCDTKCCDPLTCQFTVNSTCASGECCDLDSCQVKSAGVECRSATGECDLAEYCDGRSAICPKDVYLRDTNSCAGGKAYCFKGMCRTRDSQCKLLWGSTGKSIDEFCYQTNLNGTIFGNCGSDLLTRSFNKCTQEDMMCGLLHCSHRNEKLDFGIQAYSKLTTTKFSHYGPRGTVRETTCNTAIVDLGLEVTNPGLVPDGAKCGVGKMCWNQKCVSLSHLQENDIGEDCGEGCNGHGVCNSEGNCHCEKGFGGRFCEESGMGGSVDSGPIVDPEETSDNSVILYALFTVLLFIAVVAGIYSGRQFLNEMLRMILEKFRMKKYGHMVPPASPTAIVPPKPPRLQISSPTLSTSTANAVAVPSNAITNTLPPTRKAPTIPPASSEPSQHFITVNINNNGKITIENKVVNSPFMLSSPLLDAHEAIHEIKSRGPPALREHQRSISVNSEDPLLNSEVHTPTLESPAIPVGSTNPEPDLLAQLGQVKLKKVNDFHSHKSKSEEKPPRRLPQLPRQKTIGEFQSIAVAEVHPKRSPATEEPPTNPFGEAVVLKKVVKPRTPNLSREKLDEITEEPPVQQKRPTLSVKPLQKPPSLPQKPTQLQLLDNQASKDKPKPARRLPQIPPAVAKKPSTTVVGNSSSGSVSSSDSSVSSSSTTVAASGVAALKAKLNLEQIAGGIKR